MRLLELLYERPLVNVNLVKGVLKVTFATANKLIEHLERLGLVDEISGRRRGRIFGYTPYLTLFRDS